MGIQTQTAWVLWIRDLAEMLEPHLKEVKHQGELKLWHPEPLSMDVCSMPLYTERTGGPPTPCHCCWWPHAANVLGRPSRPNRWAPSIMWYPSATLGTNQYHSPDRLNRQELKTSAQRRGCCWKWTREGGRSKELNCTWTISKQTIGEPRVWVIGCCLK
jgi:hypothetical protein